MAEHRFHTPNPVDLEISIPAGDMEIETIDGDESFITVDGSEKLVEATTVEQVGNRIVVQLRGKKPFGITIEIGGFMFGNEKLRVRARVPHGSSPKLQGASADMSVDGRVRRIETQTASGDLVIRGEVEEDAAIKTVSGDARVDRVGRDLRANSVSGDLSIGEVGGSVQAKSVSGDMRIRSARAGEATLQSVSGDIEIGIAAGTSVDVDANSISGDLESEVPLGSDPSGIGAAGPTLVVRGKTVSGDFRLVRAS